VIDLLRQRARPYLFSNSLAPPVAAGSLKAIEIAENADDRRARLMEITRRFRGALGSAGFDLLPGGTPIIPVMVYDAILAQRLAAALDERGVFAAGFFHPVVPHGKARIRTQMSTALSDEDVAFAIDAFIEAGRTVGVI
jgi:glycine C-acetyltransferase